MENQIKWHKVLDHMDELAENRVITVHAGHKQMNVSLTSGLPNLA